MTPSSRLAAPTYAALLAIGASSAVAAMLARSPVVQSAAMIAFGVAMVLSGVHLVVFRRVHTQFLVDRMRLRYYTPEWVALIGIVGMIVGMLLALFASLKLSR